MASGFVTLTLGALVVTGEAALAIQDAKPAGWPAIPQESPKHSATSTAGSSEPAKPAGSSPIIVALPAREELHRLLRSASSEAVKIGAATHSSMSRAFTSIATAQAKAGDRDGARDTLAQAARGASGSFGGAASARDLWIVGDCQADCGLSDEARAVLEQAGQAVPRLAGNYQKDREAVRTLANIALAQARVGAREDARATAGQLLKFSKAFIQSSRVRNTRDEVAPKIAGVLASIGEFEAAFGWSKDVTSAGRALGEIADAASQSKCLQPLAARRFVHEAAARLATIDDVGETYFGLIDLALAEARLGEFDAARQSATSIGEGSARGWIDMTDGQPYALTRVAKLQHLAGDIAGAEETLRGAYRSVTDHPKMRARDGRYAQIVVGQIAIGDLSGAMLTAAAMPANRAESLALIARAQAASGDHAGARATFARALEDARSATKNRPQPDADRAKGPGISPRVSATAALRLAEIEAMAGDIPGAEKAVRSIDDQTYQQRALKLVVSTLATAGDIAGALRLCLNESRTPVERQAALEGLGQGVEARLSLNSLAPHR
jgi:tetratricopeptide (TPR) repeat protein